MSGTEITIGLNFLNDAERAQLLVLLTAAYKRHVLVGDAYTEYDHQAFMNLHGATWYLENDIRIRQEGR